MTDALHDRALVMAREEERAVIVAWLREHCMAFRKQAAHRFSPLKYRANAEERGNWFAEVAAAIESAAHLKDPS